RPAGNRSVTATLVAESGPLLWTVTWNTALSPANCGDALSVLVRFKSAVTSVRVSVDVPLPWSDVTFTVLVSTFVGWAHGWSICTRKRTKDVLPGPMFGTERPAPSSGYGVPTPSSAMGATVEPSSSTVEPGTLL